MRDVCETGGCGMNSSGYPAKDMQARHLANLLEKPMRVACCKCDWNFEGKGEDALYWQQRHRKKHGSSTKKLSRRTVRNLSSFRSPELTDEDVVEIDAEVARRRRLHGLEDAA